MNGIENVAVGDRFVYTTPSGKEVRYRCTATDVKPKYSHKPGLCVRLIADSVGAQDVVCWPEDLRNPWWSKDDTPAEITNEEG
jgi:hypothetical protein